MKYEVTGTTMQAVSIDLEAGEEVYSQTSVMAWMTESMRMDTHTGGGLWAGIKRSFSGGGLFVTSFRAERPGNIAFASRFPGSIMPVTLREGDSLLCRKETFLCAEKSVTLDVALQKRLGAGFFAGEGFILQRVSGPGTVWLDLAGEVVSKTLAAGERLLVHAGHVGIQDPSVSTDIQMVSGFKNFLFGGEGIFLATLTGPGRIWLQTMPMINLAEAIARYLPPTTAGSTAAASGSAVGAVEGIKMIASFFDNDDK